jgi:hypothetical protein
MHEDVESHESFVILYSAGDSAWREAGDAVAPAAWSDGLSSTPCRLSRAWPQSAEIGSKPDARSCCENQDIWNKRPALQKQGLPCSVNLFHN